MEDSKSIFVRYNFEILVVSLCFISYVIFCNYMMSELPYLTWFDQFPLITKYYGGTLKFYDLFTVYGEHGMFANNILFLVNVIIFKMTTFFDIYLNDVNVLLIGMISVFILRKINGSSNGKMYKFSIILACIFSFSFLQLSSGAMETQVRLGILFFVLAAIMIDKVLREQVSKKYLITTIIMILISINIFGTAYSFSGVPVIFLIIFIMIIRNRKVLKVNIIIGVTYIISIILYFLEYGLIGKESKESSNLIYSIASIILNPLDTIKGVLAYNASSLFGFATYADNRVSGYIYIFTGFIVTSIQIYAVIRFIKLKMYEKTYIPVMFMGYSIFVLCLVMVGRYSTSWEWYINNWYTVHTKLGAIGVVIILVYDFLKGKKNNKKLSIICVAFLAGGILIGNISELKRVPYEKAYYLEKQPYLFAENINELPVNKDGQTPLFQTPEVTMNAINIMKKYNLSVYRYYDAYNKMAIMQNKNIGNTLINSHIISGIYDDKWAEKKCELNIKTENEGKIILKGYYPNEITGAETGSIEVDDKLAYSFEIKEKNFEIEIDAPKNKVVNLKINNNFDFSATPPDTRRLSFIISDIEGK